MRLMRRVVVSGGAVLKNDGYVRVRDEGDKVTLTYKQQQRDAVDGIIEIETEIKDFDKAVEILQQFSFEKQSYQESKREKWYVQEVEVVLDEWPWLHPFVEVEGPSEAALRRVAEQLGLAWETAVFGDVMRAYRKQYPWLGVNDAVGDLPEVRFDDPPPPMFDHP